MNIEDYFKMLQEAAESTSRDAFSQAETENSKDQRDTGGSSKKTKR